MCLELKTDEPENETSGNYLISPTGSEPFEAYSTVPIVSDVMFEAADEDITSDNWVMRTMIVEIVDGRGETLSRLFTTEGNWQLDNAIDSNVTNTFNGGQTCDTIPWGDWESTTCGTFYVIVLHDTTIETLGPFLIGSDRADGTARENLAGWPNSISVHYPTNYRIWVR